MEDGVRTLALQRRSDERWRAFSEAPATTRCSGEPLSEEELVELSGAFRADIGE